MEFPLTFAACNSTWDSSNLLKAILMLRLLQSYILETTGRLRNRSIWAWVRARWSFRFPILFRLLLTPFASASSSDGRITEFWELGTRMDPFQRTFDQPCAWMEDCIGQVTGGHYGGGVPTPFNLFAIDWTAMVCAAIKGNSDSVLRHLQTAEANRDPAYLERLYQCVQEMVPAPENVSTASSGEALPGFTWDPAHRGSVFGWSTDLKSGQWSVHLNCHTFVVAFLRVVFDWNIPPEIGLISNIDQVLVQTTLVAQQAAPTSYT